MISTTILTMTMTLPPGMEGFPRPPGDIQQALSMYQV